MLFYLSFQLSGVSANTDPHTTKKPTFRVTRIWGYLKPVIAKPECNGKTSIWGNRFAGHGIPYTR